MTTPLELPADVHLGAAPAWWPPAPGWWLLFALVLLPGAVLAWWWLRRRKRREQVLRLFDEAVQAAGSPPAQVAAMSELLRRAARRVDPEADRLEGEGWLRFLDAGMKPPVFATGAGALLLDGGFRKEVEPAEVEALRVLARARYLSWMRA